MDKALVNPTLKISEILYYMEGDINNYECN